LFFLLLYLGILAWAFTWVKALILTVDAVALLEFRERRNLDQFSPGGCGGSSARALSA
jgi:hypothetical protein